MSSSAPAIKVAEEMQAPEDLAEMRAEAPAQLPVSQDGDTWAEMKKTAYGKLVVAPFAAQWSWEAGSGKYYAFPADANTEMELQYYKRQLDDSLEGTPAEVASGDRVYRIDFANLTQERMVTGRKRPILRELVTAQWYWSGRAGEKWYPFAEKDNESLEAGFQKWSFCMGDADFNLLTVRDTYHIDLEQMTQRNTSTGRVREIKRALGDAEDPATTTTALGNAGYVSEKSQAEPRPWLLTLKVTGENLQCRRLSCSIPPYATGACALPIVRGAVEGGFQDVLGAGRPYSVCYEDEDGDRCELVADTWKDCTRHVSKGSVLKLSITLLGSSVAGASASTSASSLRDVDAVLDYVCAESNPGASHAEKEDEDEDEEDVWAIV